MKQRSHLLITIEISDARRNENNRRKLPRQLNIRRIVNHRNLQFKYRCAKNRSEEGKTRIETVEMFKREREREKLLSF